MCLHCLRTSQLQSQRSSAIAQQKLRTCIRSILCTHQRPVLYVHLHYRQDPLHLPFCRFTHSHASDLCQSRTCIEEGWGFLPRTEEGDDHGHHWAGWLVPNLVGLMMTFVLKKGLSWFRYLLGLRRRCL
ncbi:uncharacterized protein LACBIDRAFT_313215 [Laccaria bicolor S238N-H82]|uniref:Predicted protein n=1 Tax=Laccaria bicolor (strain S238N-H82 / ATCC MYA-4686) TaxID=486041 RepID=B0DXT2_LACBS|nr:uncharacterized protein LACBIDRAFT_313215 [Laccaria bicolor S238N-H82]EDR00520.1 predicted protein [Laccaria bicolor S238N-H82]|eukprot:XP_001888747.1 predicted protein [Laccaria bicolor S238N-H82]